jgi:prevent-host-death family protein
VMKKAAVTDLKNRLSHYLGLAARRESVTIVDRGRPVARLTLIEGDDGELQALVAAGLARPPVAPLPTDFLKWRLPRASASVQTREIICTAQVLDAAGFPPSFVVALPSFGPNAKH